MGKHTKKTKNQFAARALRNGGYSAALTGIVLAILIVINAVVEMLPTKYTQIDLSPMEIFHLTDTTKKVIADMKSPVTIYMIAEPGAENLYMKTYAELYASESKMITVDRINPSTDIQLMDEFELNNVVPGSVVVAGDRYVCSNCGYETAEELEDCPECDEKKAEFKRKIRYINYNNTITTETSESTGEEQTTGIDMEGQLTSALIYVSDAKSQEVYYFTGHGEDVETAPSTSFKTEIEKLNMGFNLYNFEKYKTVPSDAAIIILNGPTTDYDEEETKEILDFLANGGSAMINIKLDTTKDFYMPNFEKILETYGLAMAGGGVLESNSKYYFDNQVYSIKPSIRSHQITSPIVKAQKDLLVYLADALVTVEEFANPDVTLTPLITTSASAYLKERGESSMQQTEDDPVGTFTLGMAVEDASKNTRVVVYSSYCLMMQAFSEAVNGGNEDLMINSVSWLGHQDDVTRVGIKKLYPSDLVPTTQDMYQMTIIVAIVIPLIFFILGGIVWYKRRK